MNDFQDLRKRLHLSVDEAAQIAKCHPNTWRRLESGDISLPEIFDALNKKFGRKGPQSVTT